ncbi:hypothetical protein E2C01_055131 [Portunus trituberculatus]|uniref:Uncharacterized protein n=1 Tax=Portunus trituberculatus TaxID=210409 RepID=A0A5B7GVS6_PORTR|nr:hypothetical protein [Portunus trituberculatus]
MAERWRDSGGIGRDDTGGKDHYEQERVEKRHAPLSGNQVFEGSCGLGKHKLEKGSSLSLVEVTANSQARRGHLGVTRGWRRQRRGVHYRTYHSGWRQCDTPERGSGNLVLEELEEKKT